MDELERDVRDALHRLAGEVDPTPSLTRATSRRAAGRRALTAATALLAVTLVGAGAVAASRSLRRQPSPPATASAGPRSCTWDRTPSPNVDPETSTNLLDAISVASDDDVWAVGDSFHPAGEATGPTHPLVFHWDGNAWGVVDLPDLGFEDGISGVAAVSSTDVWLVGSASVEDGGDRPLAAHWDGTSWSEVPTPDPGKTYSHLFAVDAVASDDVWAVGNWATGQGGAGTLAMHWDGATWGIVPSPDVPPRPQVGWSYPGLVAVHALSSNDVWGVGTSDNVAPQGPSNTLVLQWDGTAWNAVTSPDVPADTGSLYNRLEAIGGASATDLWAVGSFGLDQNDDPFSSLPEHSLVERWDGEAWKVVPTPVLEGPTSLAGVAAVSPSEAWVVGSAWGGPAQRALIERWDGSAWSVVPSVEGPSWLTAVATTPDGDLWAVGSAELPGGETWGTLVLHGRCGATP